MRKIFVFFFCVLLNLSSEPKLLTSSVAITEKSFFLVLGC